MTRAFGGVNAVENLDLAIPKGTIYGFLGPNGCGKSTLLKTVAGFLRPRRGSIHIRDEDVSQIPVHRKVRDGTLGFVPQTDNVFGSLTTWENLALGGQFMSKADCAQRIEELCTTYPVLVRKMGAPAASLSGGERQVLSLARALVNDPRLLMLDEPTTGLDPQARHLMWERLQLLLQQGKSILLTTHFMDEAERLCSRLLVLDHGRKIAEGRPRELIAQHLEPDVVEVYGQGALAIAQAEEHAALRALAARVEVSGETVFFYTAQALPLLAALGQHHQLRTLHRPANLEDLFLKLTGRQIREDG